MIWTESSGTHRAEGLYDRTYTIAPRPSDSKYVVNAEGWMPGRTCATLADAKSYCEGVERSLARG